MSDQKADKLLELLRAEAVDNRISCTKAREIASEQGIAVSEVGAALDDLKIKITGCELGCF